MSNNELNNLKELWRKSSNRAILESLSDKLEQQRVFTKRSQHALERLKRNLIIEISIGTAAILFLILVVLQLPARETTIFIVLPLVVFGVLFSYFGRQVIKMHRINLFDEKSIKETLQHTIIQLKKFIRIYFLLNWLLLPVLIGWALILSDVFNGGGLFFPIFAYSLWEIGAVITAFTIMILTIFYFPLKWYTKWMFGNHLKKLEESFSELHDVIE